MAGLILFSPVNCNGLARQPTRFPCILIYFKRKLWYSKTAGGLARCAMNRTFQILNRNQLIRVCTQLQQRLYHPSFDGNWASTSRWLVKSVLAAHRTWRLYYIKRNYSLNCSAAQSFLVQPKQPHAHFFIEFVYWLTYGTDTDIWQTMFRTLFCFHFCDKLSVLFFVGRCFFQFHELRLMEMFRMSKQ